MAGAERDLPCRLSWRHDAEKALAFENVDKFLLGEMSMREAGPSPGRKPLSTHPKLD
jgi:hypothetical protein